MYKQIAIGVLLLSGLTLIGLAGCADKVTQDNYDQVKTGMTLAEVQAILGSGTLQTGGSGALGNIGGSAKVYKRESDGKAITITFANDKVKLKTQTGL